MRNLHLFPNEKFTNPFIEFVNENFAENDHLFLIMGKGINTKILPEKNVKQISKDLKSLGLLIIEMHKCQKIFLHGLFFKELILLLFIEPWLLKKCNWIIWGGDLYLYQNREENFKSDLYEFFRRFVISNIGGLITFIKGDYELAQSWYGAKGKYYYSFMYPSNLFYEYNLAEIKNDSYIYIQVGNSADPSNNHLEVFHKLGKYIKDNVKVVCPLSYGDSEYRELVIKEGKRMFGKNFLPVTQFMPFKKYLKLLAKTDIAIFNHKRQQAMGNITTLLGLGKKVYIRNDITTWNFYLSEGLILYPTNEDFALLLNEIPNQNKFKNIDKIKKNFSKERLKKDLTKIFFDKDS